MSTMNITIYCKKCQHQNQVTCATGTWPINDIRCVCCNEKILEGSRSRRCKNRLKGALVLAFLLALIMLGTYMAKAETRILSRQMDNVTFKNELGAKIYVVRLVEDVCINGKMFTRYTVQSGQSVSVDLEQVFTHKERHYHKNYPVECR